MNKYKDAKVYKLTSKQTDKIYVGSTCKTLDERFSGHKYDTCKNRNNTKSTEILKYDDAIIELIEDCPCNSMIELLEREQYYMTLYKDIIVNIKNTSSFCEHLIRRRYCNICNNIKTCIGITRNKTPCKWRAKPDSDYCGRHTPK